jgi:predicted secreted protein
MIRRGAAGPHAVDTGDARSGRVVFLAHCLLNQNTRYPGGAVCPGVVVDAVAPYLDDGTGIVQMPCPEQRTWGGVAKRHLLRLLDLPARARAARRLLGPARRYLRWRYRRLAHAVVADIADCTASGLAVVGIVGVAGSPSCGVTTTLDLDGSLAAIAACPHRTISPGWLDRQVVGPSVRTGRGLFTEALEEELSAQHQDVPLTQFDLRRSKPSR